MVDLDAGALRDAGVTLAVLFGSRASGTAREGSDTDVGVLVDGGVPGLMDPRRARIAAALGTGDVDLVFLATAEPLLLFEVARTGRPLFEASEGAWETFRIRAVKRYYDTAWIRRIEADALRRRYA